MNVQLGAIVVYWDLNGNERAAIITRVYDEAKGEVMLAVFTRGDSVNEPLLSRADHIFYSEYSEPNSWHE